MVGVFAAATARMTPEFLECFDPEKLASKFVKVEKEFGVKFTKTKSTFNIIGQWEAVRNARKSLLKLRSNAKSSKNPLIKKGKFTQKAGTSSVDVRKTEYKGKTTDQESSENQSQLIRGKGNPKKGRLPVKEDGYPKVPEPLFYVQYQDKTFKDADSLDIDTVLDDFEKSQTTKKVSKEELKKILEKNKDQMGKPLEKGIPKGAIIPDPKRSKQTCDSVVTESNFQSTTSVMTIVSSDQTLMSSQTKNDSLLSSQIVNCIGMPNLVNSEMITTYSVNARMSTYNMDFFGNQQTAEGSAAVNQMKDEDFYYNTVSDNNRPITGMFIGNSYCSREQDSLSGMFDNYDPQSVLNPIPSSSVHIAGAACDRDTTGTDIQQTEQIPTVTNIVNGKDDICNDSMVPDVRNSCMDLKKTDVKPLLENADTVQKATLMDGINAPESVSGLPNMPQFTGSAEHTGLGAVEEESYSDINCASMTKDVEQDDGPSSVLSKILTNNTDTSNPTSPAVKFKSEMKQSKEQLQDMKLQVEGNDNLQLAQLNALQNLSTSEILPFGEGTTGLDVLTYALLSQERSTIVENEKGLSELSVKKQATVSNLPTQSEAVAGSDVLERDNTIGVNNDVQHIIELPSDKKQDQMKAIVPAATGEASDITEENEKETKQSKEKNKKTKKSNQSKTEAAESKNRKRVRKPKSAVIGEHVDSNLSIKESEEEATKQKKQTVKSEEQGSLVSPSGEHTTSSKIKHKPRRREKHNGEEATTKVTEKQLYKCTECDYQVYRKRRLAEHMGRVHGLLSNGTEPENQTFSCDECSKTFVFEKDLNRHKKIVHHGQVFVCTICNKTYKSKYVFDRHTATHEEGYIQPKFQCQICEREFTTKFSLSCHIKSEHLGMKKTYSCPTCGKTFSQLRSYKQHANVHAGIRPFVCEICGKAFTYDKSLKEHRFMHDTVRRFQCTVCQKAFRQQTCLLIHMKTHKEKKDHMCSVCGREFTQKQSLLRHERIHSGDKPFSCKICFKSFGDYAVIRKHVMMAHKRSKDAWKQEIFTEDKKPSSHYIEGGPGYMPRQSYAKQQQQQQQQQPQKPEVKKEVPVIHGDQSMLPQQLLNNQSQQIYSQPQGEITEQTPAHIEVSVASDTDLAVMPALYQTPAFSETLDFTVMEALKLNKQENYTEVLNVPLNYSLVQNLGSDTYNNIGQQQSMTIKTNPYIPINPELKTVGVGGDAYVAQFLNSPVSITAVAMETNSVPVTEVPTQMLTSISNSSPVINDSTISSGTVTMATANNGWVYPGYSAAYFNQASFAQFQVPPDN